MKKLLIVLIMLVVCNGINAQIKAPNTLLQKYSTQKTGTRAMGDTLLHFHLPDVYVNPIDLGVCNMVIEDLDGFSPSIATGPLDFTCYYSLNDTLALMGEPVQMNFYHPWETPASLGGNDTAFFWGATSDFTPSGMADNWFQFGPITIPPSGARMYWYDRTSNNRDGYEVLVSSSGMANYSDFTNPALYSEADGPSPSPTYTTDTAWELKSVAIPSWYNGTQLYFAFHHTANDMSWLYLDEIAIVEDTVVTPGACSAAFTIVQDTTNLYNYTIYSSASVGSSYTYFWDFGDTTYSSLAYPTHLYAGTGPYQICLFVNDTVTGCTTYHCDTIIPGMWATAPTTITVVPATTGIVEVLQNNTFDIFPNPVNDAATIRFTLIKDEMVNVSIVDLLGKKIATVDQRNRIAGKNELQWNTEGVSDGMYLIQVQVGENMFTKKLIVTQK